MDAQTFHCVNADDAQTETFDQPIGAYKIVFIEGTYFLYAHFSRYVHILTVS